MQIKKEYFYQNVQPIRNQTQGKFANFFLLGKQPNGVQCTPYDLNYLIHFRRSCLMFK